MEYTIASALDGDINIITIAGRLTEMTAMNAGVMFRLFYDYDEALKWLRD